MLKPALYFLRRSGVLAALLTLAAGAPAAPSFRAERYYPNIGLRFRTLGASSPEPLPQEATFTYTFTRDGESLVRNLHDPHELWYATQHAGQWRDDDGNVLIIGHATGLLPAVVSETKHVSREDYDKARADPVWRLNPDSAEALTSWVKDFAACTPQKFEALRTGFNLAHALFFPVEEADKLVYAFRAKIRQANGQTTPSDWFCAIVKIGDGTPKAKVRKDFEAQFLANVASLPQSSHSATTGIKPKTVDIPPPKGRDADSAIPVHPSRDAARKSIANMKGWWYAETPEYIFLSDIRSTAGKSLIKELQATLPALRTVFAQLVPPLDATTDIGVVRIYEDQEAYQQYVGKEREWSRGIWSPMRRELVIHSQGRDDEQTLQIIRHEGFHQYLFHATRMAGNAIWFNEGHACLFEPAVIDKAGRVEFPEGNRVRHLLDNLAESTSILPTIIHADDSAFYGGSDQQRALNYTTAWALVYFLRKGVPAQKLTKYKGILDTYLQTLKTTKDGDAATTVAFADVDMTRFKEDFADFWKNDRSSARRFTLQDAQ